MAVIGVFAAFGIIAGGAHTLYGQALDSHQPIVTTTNNSPKPMPQSNPQQELASSDEQQPITSVYEFAEALETIGTMHNDALALQDEILVLNDEMFALQARSEFDEMLLLYADYEIMLEQLMALIDQMMPWINKVGPFVESLPISGDQAHIIAVEFSELGPYYQWTQDLAVKDARVVWRLWPHFCSRTRTLLEYSFEFWVDAITGEVSRLN